VRTAQTSQPGGDDDGGHVRRAGAGCDWTAGLSIPDVHLIPDQEPRHGPYLKNSMESDILSRPSNAHSCIRLKNVHTT